jgi:hypothetical protein
LDPTKKNLKKNTENRRLILHLTLILRGLKRETPSTVNRITDLLFGKIMSEPREYTTEEIREKVIN